MSLEVQAGHIADAHIDWDQPADSLATAQDGPYTATWDGGADHEIPVTAAGGSGIFTVDAKLTDIIGGGDMEPGPHVFTIAPNGQPPVETPITITGLGVPSGFRVVFP